MNVYRLPALSDNYIFVLYDQEQQTTAVVDPAEAEPVLQLIEELGATLTTIFNTHHHADHVGGNHKLLRKFPDATVYGGEGDRGRIPGQTVFLEEGDTVDFAGREGHVFFVPGHTRAHIAYYFPAVNEHEPGELFCGDTIFAGGCGRLFEGTPAQMVSSLTKLRQLPDETRIWCAHEYTLKNLRFAMTVDPDNERLQQRMNTVQQARQNGEATVPSLLGLEKETNPFLRWDERSLQTVAKTDDPVHTFAKIRGMKDLF